MRGAQVAVVAAVIATVAAARPAPARAQPDIPAPFQEAAESYLPKAISTPLGLYRRTEKIFTNHAECVARGGTATECQAWPILCDLMEQAVSTYLERAFGAFGRHGPTIVGQLMIFEAMKTTSCGDDCFWCCLTPTGCHSSFGPSPVINCNPGYGAGTHTIGHTLITSNPTGTNACLAIPQTCDQYSECRIAGNGGYPGGLPARPSPYEPRPIWSFGWWTPPSSPSPPITVCDLPDDWRPPNGNLSLVPAGATPELIAAIGDRKARYVAESVVRTTEQVLDELPADYGLDELSDLVSFRGCVGHAHLVRFGEPFDGTHTLFPVTTGTPEVQEIAGSRRALVFLAALRVLGAIPNFYNRLVFVESRLWPCPEREAYLRDAGIDDPDAVLRETMGPLALAILKQVDGLQDYRLLAVPLPDEVASPLPLHDGCPLGTAPTVTLAAGNDAGDVTLAITAVDPDGVDAIPELPVAIDWGDGTTSDGALPVAAGTATFRHRYRTAGKYAVTAAVTGQSGLRGLAGTVLEATSGDPAAPRPIGVVRAALPGVSVFADTGNSNVGTIHARLLLEEPDGPRLIGRTPRPTVQIRQVMDVGGVPTVVNEGVTPLGALVGHNQDRTIGTRLVLRLERIGGTFWDGRTIFLRLRELSLTVWSPQRGEAIEVARALTAADLRVYYADSLTTPDDVVTAEADGTLRIPYTPPRSTNGRTPIFDRLELDLEPLLAAVDLGAPELAAFPVGVRRQWREVRPGELVAGPVEGLPEPPDPPDLPPDDDDDGGCCGQARGPGSGAAAALIVLALIGRRRRRAA